jgi:signal transduction histidine kinase
MRIRILFVSFVLLLHLTVCYAYSRTPTAGKGVIDLREIPDKERFVIKLNGEWEFYWNKMLRPHDFSGRSDPKPDLYGKVPSYWTDYSGTNIKTEGVGFATYRLTVILPSGFRKSLGFDLPVFDSSYDIYVNGIYLGGNGIPGSTEIATEAGYKRNFFRFDPESDSLSIIINVSNFEHRRGGFWLPMKTGTFNEVQKQLASSWAEQWATISLLMGFSLFFLFFFILYPKEQLMGFFSLATIGLALRPFFTSHFLIHNIVQIDWIWIVRFEYIGLFIVMTGWYWFAAKLYPSEYFKIITVILTVFYVPGIILTLFLPVRIFSYATLVFYPSILILLGYVLFQSLRGIINRKLIDFVYFLTFLLLLFGAYHDIMVSLGKSDSSAGYILSFTVVLFVFVQAALLLYKWVRAYSEKEKLHGQLEFMNRNLEVLVNTRTIEIQTRQEEIEKQSSKIAMQNKQLSETLQLKNKIFSVISHDLRSPVVNILYMLNLLKEEEYKDKYDTFANASIQYAQQVISLLENMLVWGRGQEDKIKFSPAKRDFSDIILTNLSIFKETADKKSISINFTQVGNSVAFFDKDLLDIIIRNLLSNAVKYTPRGGRISILLKDRTSTGEGTLLKICDNGVGIPEIKQKYLFTSDEISSTPGTENEKGTGFGLKLCSELVKIHNGTIAVESKEGEGTCFTIILPELK